MQYLFLADSQEYSQKIELHSLEPQTYYTCAAEVLYNNVILFQENKTVETDLGSEYITYIYTINRISVLLWAYNIWGITENNGVELQKAYQRRKILNEF